MNAAQRAREQLQTWPYLAAAPASCGTGEALLAQGAEIVHFHSARDADLHLTGPAIHRLHEELDRSTAVLLHDDSPWVTVHLECDSDADLLVSLVSVALRAHTPPSSEGAAPCNLTRVELAPAALLPQGPVSRWRGHAPHFPRRRRISGL
jgi:hypothetical protein